MYKHIHQTSREANKQFFVENCIENKNTAVQTAVSDNPSEESQTSAHNKEIMVETKISANVSQVEAVEQFLGDGNCGKGNATPNAEDTGSAEVNNIKQFNMKIVFLLSQSQA